jgi:hypothetical protein
MTPVNRLDVVPSIGELIPTTKLDRLLSEEDRKLFECQPLPKPPQTTRELLRQLAMFARSMTTPERFRCEHYPVFYQAVREALDAGVSPEDLAAELASLADSDDAFAAVIREAIEDALGGQPPK